MYFSLDRQGNLPLYQQLKDQISRSILSGELPAGTPIPPSRQLAEDLGISRKTVLEAYEILAAEGFLESRRGSGTYVAKQTLLTPVEENPSESIPSVGFFPYQEERIDFRSGLPDLTELPVALWKRLYNQVLDQASPLDFAYQEPQGRIELREELRRYLAQYRGVQCSTEQLLICSGTTQGVKLLGSLLGKPRQPAVLEDPITKDIPDILKSQGCSIHYVPVDTQGFIPEKLAPEIHPSFLYLAPSHQFPMGATMPIQRRIALIERAREQEFYIIEDDYDSEFRHQGAPVSSLHSLAPDRVIYIGTFSKTLFPALRTAYMILPQELIHKARQEKWITDLHNSSLDQLVLAAFLKEGFYVRHIQKMKRIYHRKREILLDAINKEWGNSVEILGDQTGLHLVLKIPGLDFTASFRERCYKRGLILYPVWEHSAQKDCYRDCLILGYGFLKEEALRKGISLLGKIIK